MAIARTSQAILLALVTSLSSIPISAVANTAIPTSERASEFDLAQASNNCRQTDIQLTVYDQPDRNANDLQTLPPGTEVTALSQTPDGEWMRINISGSNGYVLSTYLSECSNSGMPSDDFTGMGDVVRGCGQVVNLRAPSGAPDPLRVHGVPNSREPYDSIPPLSAVVLGDPMPIGNRIWVEVLAYRSNDPGLNVPSPTGEAWVAETGPTASANLRRDAGGRLLRSDNSPFSDLNVMRRSCGEILENLITIGQPLPARLPRGMRRP